MQSHLPKLITSREHLCAKDMASDVRRPDALSPHAGFAVTTQHEPAVAGLHKHYPGAVHSVAVLTPYKAQIRKLRSTFAASVSPALLATVDFATVDGFQVKHSSAAAVFAKAVPSRSTEGHTCSYLLLSAAVREPG